MDSKDHQNTTMSAMGMFCHYCERSYVTLRRKSLQRLSCPKHGFLTSFPHRVALGEFVRCLANKILQRNGQRLIDAEAAFIVGDTPPRPESMN